MQQWLEGAPNVAQTRCVLQGVNKSLTERIYRKERGRRDDRESQIPRARSWDSWEKEKQAVRSGSNHQQTHMIQIEHELEIHAATIAT